jgi:hypothetical protein
MTDRQMFAWLVETNKRSEEETSIRAPRNIQVTYAVNFATVQVAQETFAYLFLV